MIARRALAAALLVLVPLVPACARKKPPGDADPAGLEARGSVRLEEPVRARVVGGSNDPRAIAARVFPPRYSEEVLPEFPPQALAAGVPPVSVRVSFTVGTDGLAHDASADVSGDPPFADAFAAACLDVVDDWRFSPAWRIAVEEEGRADPIVPVESKAYLVFRFDVEVVRRGGSVGVTFGDRPGPRTPGALR